MTRIGLLLVLVGMIAFTISIVVRQNQGQTTALTEDERLEYRAMHWLPDNINLAFLFYVLLAAFLIEITLRYFEFPTPDCAFIIIFGFIWGTIATINRIVLLASDFCWSSSKEIIYIFVPVVIFNIAFSLDVHLFWKHFTQILIISFPLGVTTSIVFGIFVSYLLNFPTWDVNAFLFGILCLPSLPRGIIKILRQQSPRTKQIGVLLEGEALLSLIITRVISKLLMSQSLGWSSEWYHFVCPLMRFVLLGMLGGWCFGVLARYTIRKIYDERTSIYLFCFSFPFFVYSINNIFIAGCGSIAVMVLGVTLSKERAVLEKQTEQFLLALWDVTASIIYIVVCMKSSVILAVELINNLGWEHYANTIAIYLAYYAVRFLAFLSFSPILKRIGYGMDLKNMLVLVWGGLRSPFSVEIVGIFSMSGVTAHKEIHLYSYLIGFYFLSVLINGSTVEIMLDFLDMKIISPARRNNMTNSMRHIFDERRRIMTILKMDRFLSDTNWLLVMAATEMRHPYHLDINDEDEDEFTSNYIFTYCKDCKKEVAQKPTAKEMKEMVREARVRVLKTKKISYSRQFENGMVSKEGMQILVQAVELALDSNEYLINVEELQRLFLEENWVKKFVRYHTQRVQKNKFKSKMRPPRTYWRRRCYHIVKNRFYDKIMFLIIVFDLIILTLDMIYHHRLNNLRPVDHVFLVGRIAMTSIYIMEFFIKVLAYSRINIINGLKIYFKNIFNIFDVIVVLVYIVGVCGTISRISETSEDIYSGTFRETNEILRFLRAIRLLRIFDIFYSEVIEYLDKSIDTKMAFTYELGKCFVTGETEILDMLPYIIDNNEILQDMRKKTEEDRLLITHAIGNIQKDRPWIAITVKTKQAIYTILNSMKEAIKTLKSLGWIDGSDNEQLNAEMGQLYKQVNSIKKVDPSPPKIIFKEVSWMNEDKTIIDFLFENVKIKQFEPGQTIFTYGDVADGIYIVVTGLLMIKYEPKDTVLYDLEEYGRLPIVDYLSGTKFQESSVDYIVSGNCIGELSILTDRPYSCVVTSDSYSQVYVLKRGVINHAMELSSDPFTGLECRIWKEVSIRIASPLLLEIPAYHACTQDQIKYILERAFVPNLSRYKVFAVTEVIESIILIEGIAADYNTKDLFIAPLCIPRTVQKLILPNSSQINVPVEVKTKLLIIPEKGVDEYEVMMVAEETCELTSIGSSSRCLQHTVEERFKNRKRRRRRKSETTTRRYGNDVTSLGTIGTHRNTPNQFDARTSVIWFGNNSQTESTSVHIPPSVVEEQIKSSPEEKIQLTEDKPPPQSQFKKRQSQFFF